MSDSNEERFYQRLAALVAASYPPTPEALRGLANDAHAFANELDRLALYADARVPYGYVEHDQAEVDACGCGRPEAHPARAHLRRLVNQLTLDVSPDQEHLCGGACELCQARRSFAAGEASASGRRQTRRR